MIPEAEFEQLVRLKEKYFSTFSCDEAILWIIRYIGQAYHGRNENIFVETPSLEYSNEKFVKEAIVLAKEEFNFLGSFSSWEKVKEIGEGISLIFKDFLESASPEHVQKRLIEAFESLLEEESLKENKIVFRKQSFSTLERDWLGLTKTFFHVTSPPKHGLIFAITQLKCPSLLRSLAVQIKSFVDELASSQATIPLIFLMAGTLRTRAHLLKGHPSVDRIFRILKIS